MISTRFYQKSKDDELLAAKADNSQLSIAVATALGDTSSPAYAALLAGASSAVDVRYAPYQVLATKYLTSTGDQTANMQAAMDAAAATGADLLLPGATISMTGQLTWQCRSHSIIGTQGTILNWSDATFDGPAITFDGAYRAGTAGATPVTFKDVVINGPTGAQTTVDCLQIAGYLNPVQNSIWSIVLDNISMHGFRTQEILGTGSWSIHHRNMSYGHAVVYGVDVRAGTQTGEQFSWLGGVFDNCATGLHANAAGAMDANFFGMSFDNCGYMIDASGGSFSLFGCHVERDYYTNSWFRMTGVKSGHRSPNFTMHGGVIVANTSTAHPIPTAGNFETIAVETVSSNTIPIAVGFHNVQLISVDQRMTLVAHRETSSTNGWNGGYDWPMVSFTGMAPAIVHENNYARGSLSGTLNELINGNMEASPTFGIDPGPTGSKLGIDGWVTPNTTTQATLSWDTSTFHSGTQSLKVAQSGLNGNLVEQWVAVTSRTFYQISFWWSCSAFTGATKARFTIQFNDVNGNNIGSRNLTNQLSETVATGTVDWTFAGGVIQAPPGAAMAKIQLDLSGASGTFWLDDVQAVRFT